MWLVCLLVRWFYCGKIVCLLFVNDFLWGCLFLVFLLDGEWCNECYGFYFVNVDVVVGCW